MRERLVINTGPLIALAKGGVIDVVGALPISFVTPQAVRRELDTGAAKGHVAVRPSWLEVRELRGPLSPMAEAVLDRGEAEVIQLALDEGIDLVCIDERAGRRLATAVGLRVVGTLGLLLRAKRDGLLPALAPVVEKLKASGIWYDDELVRRVLVAAGEG